MNCFLGIDTSAYTTSLAVVDDEGNRKYDLRRLLAVPAGERGLRQSKAFFQHFKFLPELFALLDQEIFHNLKAIGVSISPRPRQESYMPVFKAGSSVAEILSLSMGLPLYKLSHQEGHIMAGLGKNNQSLINEPFLAIHFSGGTSDVLRIEPQINGRFSIVDLGKSADLHVGQFIDRLGVAMGFDFPAGQQLEKLAESFQGSQLKCTIPIAVNGLNFSFSGAEASARRLLQAGASKEELAFAILRVIAKTLETVLLNACKHTGIHKVLLVGGVMSNQIIKERLKFRLEHRAAGMKLFFAEPNLCSDNAVGIAQLASLYFE